MNLTIRFVSLFLTVSVLTGCPLETPFPVSYQNSDIDSRILNQIWQSSDNRSVIQILPKSIPGSIIEHYFTEVYTFNDTTQRFEKEATEPKLLFSSISDQTGKILLISSLTNGDNGRDSKYNICSYRIDKANNLILKIVEDSIFYTNTAKKITNPESLRNFLKSNMRNPKLFDPNETRFTARSSFVSLVKPAFVPIQKKVAEPISERPKRDGSYGIKEMTVQRFIRELNVWDDPTDWLKVDSKNNTIKFFSTGIRLHLENAGETLEYYGTNITVAGTVKTKSGSGVYYRYTGIAKTDGEIIGNFTVYILGSTYDEVSNGTAVDPRIAIDIDYALRNVRDEGFLRTLIKGNCDQIKFDFITKTN